MATTSGPVTLRTAKPAGVRALPWPLSAFIAALAAALLAAPAGRAQALPDSEPATAAAPQNFIMHEAPEPRAVVLHFEDAEAQTRSVADLKGKVVLLNLWATWCPPCVKEIPALDRLAAALEGTEVTVVAVSMDRKGIAVVRKAFAELHVHTLTPYVDPSGQALRAVRGMGLPMSLLIDRDGHELGRIVGPAAWDDAATIAFLRQAGGQTQR